MLLWLTANSNPTRTYYLPSRPELHRQQTIASVVTVQHLNQHAGPEGLFYAISGPAPHGSTQGLLMWAWPAMYDGLSWLLSRRFSGTFSLLQRFEALVSVAP